MPDSIIPIASRIIAGTATETVHARKLHEFLISKQEYSNWIKSRINKYGFIENEDFCLIKKSSKGRGGHNAVEHYITLDMAKELAMVERNDKGREARRYFIACEKRLKSELKEKAKAVPELEPVSMRVVMEVRNNQVVRVQALAADSLVLSPEGLAAVIASGEYFNAAQLVDVINAASCCLAQSARSPQSASPVINQFNFR